MNIEETIRKEIERQRQFIEGLFTEGDNSFYDGQDDAYCYILALLAFLESIQEQPKLKPMNIPSGGGAMGTTPPKFKLEVEKQPADEPEYYQHFDPNC